jgi:hypothetical protein
MESIVDSFLCKMNFMIYNHNIIRVTSVGMICMHLFLRSLFSSTDLFTCSFINAITVSWLMISLEVSSLNFLLFSIVFIILGFMAFHYKLFNQFVDDHKITSVTLTGILLTLKVKGKRTAILTIFIFFQWTWVIHLLRSPWCFSFEVYSSP